MKVRLRPVSPDQLHQTVGHLAGLKDCPAREAPDPCPVVDQPMLVLCGFSASRLDTLLKHLRQAQVRFPYKAVLTATNRDWPLCDLYRELVGGAPPDERPGPGGLIPGISCGNRLHPAGKGGIMAWLGAGRQTRREWRTGALWITTSCSP